MTIVDNEIDLRTLIEIETPPACEGPSHPSGTNGHDANKAASWLLIPPCGHDWLACDPWVQNGEAIMRRKGAHGWYYDCWVCGARNLANATNFIRIDA